MDAAYPLGSTGLRVSPIGLGCWQFSDGRGLAGRYWPSLPQQTVRDIVRVSLAAGITWFDTAEVYGKGASETALATALRELDVPRARYVLADKWFPALRCARSIRRTFPRREEALLGLGIDLHQIHHPFSFSSVEKQVEQMGRLVVEGRVQSVGVSNFSEPLMRRAHAGLVSAGVPLATNQVRYSLIDRAIERNGVLGAASELGITIIAYSPLGQGILTGKYHEGADIRASVGPRRWMRRFRPDGLQATRPLVELLHATAAAHDAVPAQVALAWVVQRHGTRIVAIPGATSVAQAESNAAALRIHLTADEITELDAAGLAAERSLAGR